MLCLGHHCRGSSGLPNPSLAPPALWAGLLTIWLPRHSEGQRAAASQPAPHNVLSSRQHTHFATRSRRDDLLQEKTGGKDTFLLENHLFVFSSILFLPSLDLPLPNYCWDLAVLTHPLDSQENAAALFPLLTLPPGSSFGFPDDAPCRPCSCASGTKQTKSIRAGWE